LAIGNCVAVLNAHALVLLLVHTHSELKVSLSMGAFPRAVSALGVVVQLFYIGAEFTCLPLPFQCHIQCAITHLRSLLCSWGESPPGAKEGRDLLCGVSGLRWGNIREQRGLGPRREGFKVLAASPWRRRSVLC